MDYPERFKEKMVRRMTGINAISANELSEEVEVHQSTLSRWLREAGNIGDMSKKKTDRKASRQKRPQDWTAGEKFQVVLDATSVSEEDLGAFLRSKGLHQVQLERWRSKVTEASLEALKKSRSSKKNSTEARRIRQLEGELRRKDKALAETAAILVLKKKVEEIWGDGDGPMESRNGR